MGGDPFTISRQTLRRLIVTKQRLAGPLPTRITAESLLSVVRDLGYVQWDPVSVVAPSHLLTFWARLGNFSPTILEKLLWQDKSLFEHWTPMASLVLAEDYPLYRSLMQRYPESLTRSWGNHRAAARKFLAEHAALRSRILSELKEGPRTIGQFADHSRTKRSEGEWSAPSDASLMIYHLTMSGDVMVVGHEGNQNLWGLSDEFLPDGLDRDALSEDDAEREAAQRAVRALGAATPREITLYFVRGRYDRLKQTLAKLEEDSAIHRVTVEGLSGRDERYVHHRDVPLLNSLRADRFEPRLSLVPPFDNLVGNSTRTQLLFGFDYVREQFLPKEKRRFGTYVLPIVWGERIIGRIDPRLDKASGNLQINAVFAEPGAPREREVAESLAVTISRLAKFVNARKVTYTSRVPAPWKSELR
jgi:uncharacterized protein